MAETQSMSTVHAWDTNNNNSNNLKGLLLKDSNQNVIQNWQLQQNKPVQGRNEKDSRLMYFTAESITTKGN